MLSTVEPNELDTKAYYPYEYTPGFGVVKKKQKFFKNNTTGRPTCFIGSLIKMRAIVYYYEKKERPDGVISKFLFEMPTPRPGCTKLWQP